MIVSTNHKSIQPTYTCCFKKVFRSFHTLFKKLIHCFTCTKKQLSSVKISKGSTTKTNQKISQTASAVLHKDGIDKGCNADKLDYLVKRLTKNDDTVVWSQILDLGTVDVQEKTLILQTIAIKSPEALKLTQENLAGCLKDTIEFGEKAPSKIFIPIAYKYPASHSMLIVIEPNPLDAQVARITTIDSFWDSNSYCKTLEGFVKNFQTIFPSKDTTIVKNQVTQQTDGLTCGFHVLENILLLAKKDNVQNYVEKGNLPTLSKKEIKNRLNKHIKKIDAHSISMKT